MGMSENKITISQKIELEPNNKAKTHFRKAFGCARLAYNWGLAKWQECYEAGVKKSHLDLKKEFNALKKTEFPFTYEVSKYATQQPFIHLNLAFQKFFRDLKQGKVSYPKFKKKSNTSGSYYIGGDQVRIKSKAGCSKSYLDVPNLGLVKMRESLRFKGKINSVTISQRADKFFASFSIECDRSAYLKTRQGGNHKELGLGIDVGLKNFVSLSNGLKIDAPKPLDKHHRLLIKRSRQLSRKLHPKTKEEVSAGIKQSNNYKKASMKVAKLHRKIADIRKDFLHKLTSTLTRHAQYFCIEDLNVSGMLKKRRFARAISDVSFYEFKRQLEYKSQYLENVVITVDRYYPSSKVCSHCGSIKETLKLSDRIYQCDACGMQLDRDYNASLNLEHELKKQIGKVLAEYTPADLTALQDDLAINHLVTSKVETGIQQKSCL